MPPVIIDIGVIVLILGMTYALASEGLWGAALMFFNAVFAGLIAFNFYEPLAALLATNVDALSGYADALCLLVLFAVALLLLRLTTDSLGPMMVRFPSIVYHIGRWLFGLLGASVTMAIILIAFHVSPIHKAMFYGAYPFDHKPPFGWGLDWHWLGFFQYSTGQTFAIANENDDYSDPTGEYGSAKVFDPRGRWLIDHQNARPYGEEFVPSQSSGDAGAEGEGEAAEAPEGLAGGPGRGGPGPEFPGAPPGPRSAWHRQTHSDPEIGPGRASRVPRGTA